MRFAGRVLFALAVPIKYLLADKLLLLGDSIDRYTVHEWCALQESKGVIVDFKRSWCSEFEENRGVHKWHCCSCQTQNDTVAAVHLFGSSADGPYHQGLEADEYQPTKFRLTVMIPKFISLFGNPDRIMFHTSQWDMRSRGSGPNEHTPLEKFINDTVSRLDEISEIIGDEVDLGVRTAAWSKRGGTVIHEYNNAIQDIAQAKNLTFFDFSRDIWSSVNHNFTKEWHLFRDDIHPMCPYPERAAEKMLDRLYTNYLKFGSLEKSVAYRNKFDDMLLTRSHAPFLLDISGNTTYYHDIRDSSWYVNPAQSYLSALRLGDADLFEFDNRVSNKVSNPKPSTPDFFRDGTIFNATAGNQLYHYRSSILTKVLNSDYLPGLCKSADDVLQLTEHDSHWLKLVTLCKAPLMKAYATVEPWVLMNANQRDLYWIKDCTRIKLHGTESLASINKTFDDVVLQKPWENFDIFPLLRER